MLHQDVIYGNIELNGIYEKIVNSREFLRLKDIRLEAGITQKEVANILNETKKNGKRIISVGTTSTRTLETVMTKYKTFKKCFGNTDIFIYPGYKFKAVDVQITNFHLPKSTLFMLVSAFASREIILNAYKEAVKQKYRFFSFGDSMLIGDFDNE